MNRTSGPNSPAAEMQPVAKIAAEALATATAEASNRVWICDTFDRLRYALRVLPAETRLTVYRRFDIENTSVSSKE